MEQKGPWTMKVNRVIYGLADTLLEDREYRLPAGGPVGNMAEWKDFAAKKGYDKVQFLELDGSTWEQYTEWGLR